MHVEFYAQSVGCHNARYGDNWRSRGRMSRASLTSTSELTEFIFFSSFRIFHFRPIRFTTSCSESILFLSRGVTVDIKFVTKATLIQTCMCVCVCVCVCVCIYILSLLWRCGPTRAMAYSFLRFLDHTQRRITVGRTPLEE